MFPDPSQAPVELQTISVTAEVLTALVQLRNNNQVRPQSSQGISMTRSELTSTERKN